MTINLCLFGAGRIGRIHGANIAAHRDATLKYVVDVDPAAAARLATGLNSAAADVQAALSDDDVQGVVIATSTDTHLSLIEAAASARIKARRPSLPSARLVSSPFSARMKSSISSRYASR